VAIYLDTNVIPRRGELHAPHIAALEGVAEAVQQSLVLPAMVLAESVSARRRDIEEAFDVIRIGLRQAEKLVRLEGIYLPDPAEALAAWDAELRRVFAIAPLPNEAAEEALLREVNRVRPARDGRGARDAAIWLTVLSDHRRRGGEGHFVSANTDDFGDPSARSQLHPDLQAELAGLPPLHFAASIDALLDALASKAAVSITGAGLLGQPVVVAALSRVVEDVIARVALDSPLAGRPPAYLTQAPLFSAPELGRTQGFEVAGTVYAFILMKCRATIRAGVLKRYGLGGSEMPVDLELSMRLRLWLELGKGAGQVLAADATLSRPPDVLDARPSVSLISG
jgi:hypothetical protein